MSSCDQPNSPSDPLPTQSPKYQIIFVTDPLCSHCWAMEPAWRKFLYHYEDYFSWRYVYGGLLPGWEGFCDSGSGICKPEDVIPHWKNIADRSGQPIDPSVWISDPIDSSYPASQAAHVVRFINPRLEDAFLRRVRHCVFLEAKNIAKLNVLSQCAADVGIDREQFLTLYPSEAVSKAFQRDLKEASSLGITGFPTLIFSDLFPDTAKQTLRLEGACSFEKLEEMFLNISQIPRTRNSLDLVQVLNHYALGTTQEFSALFECSPKEVVQILQAHGASQKSWAGNVLWSSTH